MPISRRRRELALAPNMDAAAGFMLSILPLGLSTIMPSIELSKIASCRAAISLALRRADCLLNWLRKTSRPASVSRRISPISSPSVRPWSFCRSVSALAVLRSSISRSTSDSSSTNPRTRSISTLPAPVAISRWASPRRPSATRAIVRLAKSRLSRDACLSCATSCVEPILLVRAATAFSCPSTCASAMRYGSRNAVSPVMA